jgi:plastocyanin
VQAEPVPNITFGIQQERVGINPGKVRLDVGQTVGIVH